MNTAERSREKVADPSRCRPFQVADAMIAVAATAVALALGRIVCSYYARRLGGIPLAAGSGVPEWRRYLERHPSLVGAVLASGCSGLMMLLLVASVAFLAMRLRQPSPPLDVLVRQPGMVAAEAMWAGLVAGLVLDGLDFPPAFGMLALALPVPTAWATLALTGRWKPEPGWIDRFGRALGARRCLLVAFYLAAMGLFHAFAEERP